MRVRAIAVVAPATEKIPMPSSAEIQERQDVHAIRQRELDTLRSEVSLGQEGGVPCRASGGGYMLWISQSERTLQARVMVCARTQGAGHQGIRNTVHRCGTLCAWAGMENVVVEFVRQCLYCVYPEAGNMVHRPLGEVIHGMEVGEVLYFNNLRLGASDVLLIQSDGVSGVDYFYLFVLLDGDNGFV